MENWSRISTWSFEQWMFQWSSIKKDQFSFRFPPVEYHNQWNVFLFPSFRCIFHVQTSRFHIKLYTKWLSTSNILHYRTIWYLRFQIYSDVSWSHWTSPSTQFRFLKISRELMRSVIKARSHTASRCASSYVITKSRSPNVTATEFPYFSGARRN